MTGLKFIALIPVVFFLNGAAHRWSVVLIQQRRGGGAVLESLGSILSLLQITQKVTGKFGYDFQGRLGSVQRGSD